MSSAIESGASIMGSADDKSATESLLHRLIGEALKLGGFVYVVGFVVIMVQTARLNAPVVEAFHFQNILAGLPVGVPLCIAVWLWPTLIRRIEPGPKLKYVIIFVVVTLLVGVPLLFKEARWMFGEFSTSVEVMVISVIVFLLSVSFFYQAYQKKNEEQEVVFRLMCVYSGVIVLVLVYAIFGYPNMPQSVGGGRPVRVKLYFKDAEPGVLAEGSATSDKQPSVSEPVYLYYQTGSSLLISKGQSPDQPLIQIPTDQVRAVVWLESRAK
jgi:hypothetical protein